MSISVVSLDGIYQMEEEFLSVLLAFGGELGVSLSNQRPEHPRANSGCENHITVFLASVGEGVIAGEKTWQTGEQAHTRGMEKGKGKTKTKK